MFIKICTCILYAKPHFLFFLVKIMEYLRSETEEIYFEREKENVINRSTKAENIHSTTTPPFLLRPHLQISEISKLSMGVCVRINY